MADKPATSTPPAPKRPRRETIAINNLLKQRDKAIAVRDGAISEIKKLDAALLALGWPE